jgi:hypothetical protein
MLAPGLPIFPREAHAVDHQHGLRLGIGAGRLGHLLAGQAGDAFQLGPVMAARRIGEFLEA